VPLARLFDPFFTTTPAGLGMGLAICRSIAEAHEGRLECIASGPEGSAFRLRLPRGEGG
jgi:signal transduction histidine kinase